MIILIILFLGLILRLINLNQSYWLDEAAQVIESQRPFIKQFDIAADFHPPLYHLLLHFWLKFGTSEVFVRLPSVFMGVASIYIFYKISRVLKYKSAGLLGALLLAVSSFSVYYSQEARPYMLFTLLSLCSIYYWLKKDWTKFIISNVFLLYSNYFASFLLLGQFLTTVLLRKKLIKNQLKSLFISYIFLIPWLPSFFNQLQLGLGSGFSGWTNIVSESTFRNIPSTFAKFMMGKVTFDNKLIYALILTPSLIAFILCSIFAGKSEKGRLFLSLFLSSFLPALLISLFFPVLAPQRLIFLLPVFILIIIASKEIISRNLFILNYSIILITSFLGLFLYYKDPRFQREDWRQSVNWLESNASYNHLVLFAFPEPFAPFIWYNQGRLNATGVAKNFRVDNKALKIISEDIKGKEYIYYYSYLAALTDPDSKIQQFLEKSGYLNIETKNFPGVGFVYKYEKREFY